MFANMATAYKHAFDGGSMNLTTMTMNLWLLIGSCVVVTGCGSVRPSGPPDALACGLDRFVVRDIYEDWSVYRARQLRLEALDDPNPSFNVLALSAGGEFGAYGAGFLSGWGSVGKSALPSRRTDIQVGTGVSTGAILATHAFLGKDTEIEAKYRSLSGKQIYKSRSLLELIQANSRHGGSDGMAKYRGPLQSRLHRVQANRRSAQRFRG